MPSTPPSTPAPSPGSVTVLGAGVVGLTTAIVLRSYGFEVTLVSKSTPEIPTADIEYTSPKGAANWHSFADRDDVRMQRWDSVAFHMLFELATMDGTGVKRHLSYEVGGKKPEDWVDPWFANFVPGYRHLLPHELPPSCTFGYVFQGVSIDVPNYLLFLLRTFRRMGGVVKVASVGHIDELFAADAEGGKAPTFVVNCAGMGARKLGGVEDQKIFPTRGQTVLIRAPGFNEQWMRFDEVCYVIPRPDGSGTVCCGGTFQADEWDLEPHLDSAASMLRRCVAIAPGLLRSSWGGQSAPEQAAAPADPDAPMLDFPDVEIIRHQVGLRPSRIGGARVEVEWRQVPSLPHQSLVVHNYGHSGYGYQSSWGTASHVLALALRALGVVPPEVQETDISVVKRAGRAIRVKL
ncbi:nucleotide-binding domain-containing protein [Gonapodya prolifera JEL478]|uniref:Nucleotide-binding domain-containing protein n=1 Tax=Gonapodya prolifera (strain JEL478) TaxID=1344416 RepID=A0A139AWE0_GONPJ|nr:nucleotide-binding domain-containing protein [Gonapodya prolifera JEL478]|eukprot:KXS21024.1 nucleotide-binding domain-containing protein [Gonapodya prolifera JEL478]